VNSSGPFSAFPGIDRIIALLDGDGMLLQFADGAVHTLNQRWSPFAFGGEAQLQAELCGSPSRDFNLMLRRGRAQGHIVTQRASCTIVDEASSVLLFCAAGSWRIGDGIDHDIVLHEGDHVVFSSSGDTAVDMLAAGCLFCVNITLLHNAE
jgi:environmental stress-induced protein Ves